jgi:DNA-binding IscR family transcriptional regulator
MHDAWHALRTRILAYLEQTSIADITQALNEKRVALAKPGRRKAAAKRAKKK